MRPIFLNHVLKVIGVVESRDEEAAISVLTIHEWHQPLLVPTNGGNTMQRERVYSVAFAHV